MKKKKNKRNYGGIAIAVIIIVALSMAYHQHLLKESVIRETNSEEMMQSSEPTVVKNERTNEVQNIEEKEVVQNDNPIEATSQEEVTSKENEPKEDDEKNKQSQNTESLQEQEIKATEAPKQTPIVTTMTKTEVVAGNYSQLSNATCAWGFVRKSGGVQPEFYGPHAKVLDEYEGIYVGNKDNPVLYLTFDEGYENGYTGAILDTLKEKKVTATFFVTMPYVKQNADLVKRMIAEGHIVGNHTVNHPSMPEVKDDTKLMNEVMELHNYVKDNFNYTMSYLRPPKGEFSARTAKICLDLGYRNVLWSSAYADWDPNNQKGTDYAKKMTCDNLHNGNVLLLHAVSKDNSNALGEIIDEARNRGYTFASLDEFER